MKFYYKDQLIRTSKTHAYNWAILTERPDGTYACHGCRVNRSDADSEASRLSRRGVDHIIIAPLEQRGGGCAARPFSASGSCDCFHVGLSFLRPGAAGCSWLLCGRCSFTSALEALTQPPLGELCAVPFALVGVQRAGRASLEFLVDRGVVDAQAGRDVDRPISEQMPRLDLLPVLEGQVAVLSRQSHLRPMGL